MKLLIRSCIILSLNQLQYSLAEEPAEVGGCAHENPCNNRGVCVNEDGNDIGYTCTCDLGYAGTDCEYHVCDEGVAENLCNPAYTIVSTCAPDPETNTCRGQCIEAPERTDCHYWGPACAAADTFCWYSGTESCDYDPDYVLGWSICTCKPGYFKGENSKNLRLN